MIKFYNTLTNRVEEFKPIKEKRKYYEEHVIEGANHSGFAYYNTQSDDNISLITIDKTITTPAKVVIIA